MLISTTPKTATTTTVGRGTTTTTIFTTSRLGQKLYRLQMIKTADFRTVQIVSLESATS